MVRASGKDDFSGVGMNRVGIVLPRIEGGLIKTGWKRDSSNGVDNLDRDQDINLSKKFFEMFLERPEKAVCIWII